MDASIESKEKSLLNHKSQSIGIPQAEETLKGPTNTGLHTNTTPASNTANLDAIVVEYLQKKGYKQTAEFFKTELQGLNASETSQPQPQQGLLKDFGPQEAVQLTQNERDALLSVDSRLRVLYASSNWDVIKTRLISHIVSQNPSGAFNPLPFGAQPHSYKHPISETARGGAVGPKESSTRFPVKYPAVETVYRFSDGLVVGNNPTGIVVGHVYDSIESAEPTRRHDNLPPGLNRFGQPPLDDLAASSSEELVETEVLYHESDEPSRPATPRLPRRTGSQSPSPSLSRARSVDSTASARGTKRKFSGTIEKPFFCFHDSCSTAYANSKPLETHIERSHKEKWPELPGTCDHEGSVKTFRKWDDSLSHFIHHQKEYGMTRKQYDQMHHTSLFWLTHSDYRVHREDTSTTHLINSNINSPSHLASGSFMFDTTPNTDFDINAMPWEPGA